MPGDCVKNSLKIKIKINVINDIVEDNKIDTNIKWKTILWPWCIGEDNHFPLNNV